MSTAEKTRSTLTRMTPPAVVRMVQGLLMSGLKRTSIAERAGVCLETVRRIERGQIKPDERGWRRLLQARGEILAGPRHRCPQCGMLIDLERCLRCAVELRATMSPFPVAEEAGPDDPGIEYLPDAEEITARCRAVRESWPPGEETKRLRADQRRVPARIPEIDYHGVDEFLPNGALREATLAADRRPRVLLATLLLAACVACFAGSAAQAQQRAHYDRLAAVELGKHLFFEKGVSDDGTTSCATCHDPQKGYTDGLAAAVGVRGQLGDKRRSSPPLLGVARRQSKLFFVDGRTLGIDQQAGEPIQNAQEMGDQTREDVIARLRRSPRYQQMFRRAFGGNAGRSVVTLTRFKRSIADFESLLVAHDTPLERRQAGYEKALSPLAEQGFQLMSAARCFECHAGTRLTDDGFHNNGVAFFLRSRDRGRSDILPEQDETAADQGAFMTPSLVAVTMTGPYMHNGALPDLPSVVRGYNRGWIRDERDGRRTVDRYLDPRIVPQRWTPEEETAVLACLTEGTLPAVYPNVEDPFAPKRPEPVPLPLLLKQPTASERIVDLFAKRE